MTMVLHFGADCDWEGDIHDALVVQQVFPERSNNVFQDFLVFPQNSLVDAQKTAILVSDPFRIQVVGLHYLERLSLGGQLWVH